MPSWGDLFATYIWRHEVFTPHGARGLRREYSFASPHPSSPSSFACRTGAMEEEIDLFSRQIKAPPLLRYRGHTYIHPKPPPSPPNAACHTLCHRKFNHLEDITIIYSRSFLILSRRIHHSTLIIARRFEISPTDRMMTILTAYTRLDFTLSSSLVTNASSKLPPRRLPPILPRYWLSP